MSTSKLKKVVTFEESTVFIDLENKTFCHCCKDKTKDVLACKTCFKLTCEGNCMTGDGDCFDCAYTSLKLS